MSGGKSDSRSDQPAIAGRHRCSGARQSTPSMGSDSCAEVNDSVSPALDFGQPLSEMTSANQGRRPQIFP